MKKKHILKYFLVVCIVALASLACSKKSNSKSSSSSSGSDNSGTSASCSSETFTSDSYVTGTIRNQNQWAVDQSAGFDEAIVHNASVACRGTGVWKINSSVTSGAFSNQPASPDFTKQNGESSVRSSGGTDSMSVSFYIRSISTVADGSSFTVNLSPTAMDRATYVRFDNRKDSDGGLKIIVIDGNFANQYDIKQNLVRGQWYRVEIVFNAVDGVSNDVMKTYVNGVLVGTSTSLEDYYHSVPQAVPSFSRVMFRIAIAAASLDASFTSPQGFYIDDFTQKSFNASAPSTIVESYSTGFEP